MQVLNDHIIEALFGTLLTFFWQSTIIAGFVYLGLKITSSCSAKLRYGLCVTSMALIMLLPIILMVMALSENTGLDLGLKEIPYSVGTIYQQLVPVIEMEESSIYSSNTKTIDYFGVALFLWLMGALYFLLRVGLGQLHINRILRFETKLVSESIRLLSQGVAARVGVKQAVLLVQGEYFKTPCVVGWLRPCIIIPSKTLAELSTAQLEAVLLHEFVHIKRRDYLINLLQNIVQAVWFFHPVVGWVSKKARIERECSCDDSVIEILKGDKLTYAQALVRLSNDDSNKLAINARAGSLLSRLRRFSKPKKRFGVARLVSLAILGSTLVILLLLSLAFPFKASTSESIQFTTPINQPSAFLLRQTRKQGDSTAFSVATMQIQGSLKSRPGATGQPALVVISSCDVNRQALTKRVQQLSSWGYATLRISPCSIVSKQADQAFAQHDMPMVAYGALNYLRQHRSIDGDRVGILDWTDKGNVGLSVVNEDGVQQLFDYKFRTAITATLNCRKFIPPYVSSVMILSDETSSRHDKNYCRPAPLKNTDIAEYKIVIVPKKLNGDAMEGKTMDAVHQFLAATLI